MKTEIAFILDRSGSMESMTHPAMNRNSLRQDWFFSIDEAPVLATVTRNGVVRDVRVLPKKALVAADTGDIVGIVGTGYKVFTNREAVNLCQRFCLEAFPDTKVAEWTFVDGHGPGTRSWTAMDIHHRAHAMNLMGIEGGRSAPHFRHDRPTLERRAGAWLRGLNVAMFRPGFSFPGHLAGLEALGQPTNDRRRASPRGSTDQRITETQHFPLPN